MKTFQAVLRGGQLDWGAGGPPDLPPGDVPVRVTLLPAPGAAPDYAAAMAALQAIADAGGPSEFGDAVEWQRETRIDRPLPGRE